METLSQPSLALTQTHFQTPLIRNNSLSQLKQLHAHLLKSPKPLLQTQTPQFLTQLLSLPNPSSSLDYAVCFFLHSPSPNFSHRILTRLPAQKSLGFYARMRMNGIWVDRFLLSKVIKAAARTGEGFGVGREVHGVVVKMGFENDAFLQTGLIGFYGSLGWVEDARKVFDRMGYRDVVAWSIMCDGYCQVGRYGEAIRLFEVMKSSGVTPDPVILSTIINACSRTGNLALGKVIHSEITETNLQIDGRLQTSLITMYSNCESMRIAQTLYDELSPKNPAASTSMVFGYAKLGQIEQACFIFDSMAEKDLVAWSAMISGYAESDRPIGALKLFNQIQHSNIHPDQIMVIGIISACANLGALDQAQWVHFYVNKNGFNHFLSVNNALIDMFSRCGSLTTARKIFNEMPRRNVISWTSMITGLAMHGEGASAIALFDQMKVEGASPNRVTFIGLLHACSHSGLVYQGRRVFKSMTTDYGVEPEERHYGCMVDLFGRARLFKEAVELIGSMPFKPNVVIWGALLSACRAHGEVGLGEFAASRILELDPCHDGAYVLLSNIYARAEMWGKVSELRRTMRRKAISKEKGCSWTELNGEVHEFLTGDKTHPKSKEIYEELDVVVRELEMAGYDPHLGSVLMDLEEDEKRSAILSHSEKLAFSFGLISSDKGASIHIVKNLRVCEDCHGFLKLASKVFGREIIVRDRTRFHHYKDGVCSCGDFWFYLTELKVPSDNIEVPSSSKKALLCTLE